MATFRKRNAKWQAQVRRAGFTTSTKSFHTKADALAWARKVEREADKGIDAQQRETLQNTTVSELLERYRDDVTPNKRGSASERYRIKTFLAQSWASTSLDKLSTKAFAAYRDERLLEVKPNSVVRELGLLRAIFATAINEWDIRLTQNPIAGVRFPRSNDARCRRLHNVELETLLTEACNCSSPFLNAAILLSLETGLRRGELLNVSIHHVDFELSTLLVPMTKTGRPRNIPLTNQAVTLLKGMQGKADLVDGKLFACTPNALRLAWERCRKRASRSCSSVADFRFHDLRHEAISRFFERGLSIPEVALISGHKDLRMLFRYTHLNPADVARKLNEGQANA
ncbi:putative integrase/recombinase [Maritalea myrionectae]|uniref:Putative integrase/recombinase n=1 Tax=Maritalea myrionectae TaxID=454601 RepID=A0A2R4M970_9HYPH|nr:tyrosine-type recombinase/integrase [Maritalea myrionectae]AVX02570.1 putative integrase/recombinase [Maritalea myrionectae]